MIWSLLTTPLLSGLLALVLRSNRLRRLLLVSAAAVQLALTAVAWIVPPAAEGSGWVGIDALSQLFLGITGVLFMACSLYAVGTLRHEEASRAPDPSNLAERIFTACLLFFLASMTLVTVSRHLGLLWVAIEATTLSSAPLIYHHRHRLSLEAAWKYLLICSVGIALALLGNFFLAVSASVGAGRQIHMFLGDLLPHAAALDPAWLKAGFLLLLVGYGTKMGLAPMHSWLPDAHSEAPSVVSALLSGALLNCAFLGILRVEGVLEAAGLGGFGRSHLVLFGLVSMGVAALFLLLQVDFKRMLAYSSVEHMGVLALGVGLGGAGSFGALLHAVNHSLAKAALFLAAGGVLTVCGSKRIDSVRGLAGTAPWVAGLWTAGLLAVAGSPPFGLFASELLVLRAALEGHRWWVAGGYLAALAAAFAALLAAAVKMVFGGSSGTCPRSGGGALSLAPPAALLAGVLLLGLTVPGPLVRVLNSAAALLGGR